MRFLLIPLLVAGCGKKADDTGTPVGSPAGTTGVGTPTGPTTTPGFTIEESGVVPCSLPDARGLGYYERRTAPHPPASGSFTWGGGVISGDFDGDGTLDLVVATQAGPELWLTRPGPTPATIAFDKIDDAFGVLSLDYAVGGTAADLDADGDLDLVLTRWERNNTLLTNDGTGHFSNTTPDSWRANVYKTQSASVADMDGDGDLDVFFGNYGEKPDTFDDQNMPPADPAELYRNDGAGTWVDVSGSLPTAAHDGYTFASGWWHVWGSALPDLVIANDFGKVRPSLVARNLGSGAFAPDLDWHPGWEDMGMAVADVNGDAVPDFLYSSWKTASTLASGITYGLPGQWIETATSWNIDADVDNRNQVYGWGAEWGDLDNDTDQDAMILYGYWSTYTEAGDPLSQIDGLYVQTGLLSFTQSGGDPLWQVNDSSRSRGLVFADLNDDGWLDIIKGQPEADSLLYLSRCGNSSWLRVRLRDQKTANTHGIGATLRATSGAFTQTRWIHAGSSGMYGGAPPEAHFGLGARPSVDTLQVIWPDGEVTEVDNLNAKQVVTITRSAELDEP